MRASQENCPLCDKELGDEEGVVIGEKGAEGVNRASNERGDSILVAAGTELHKRCQMNYINKKKISLYNKAKLHPPPPAKRARVSVGPYDSRMHCVFCRNEVVKTSGSVDYEEYSSVKTDGFVETIMAHCRQRNNDWAFTV